MSTSTGSELAIGYASLFVSCAAFGFMFAPLKRLDSKDGVFVQWIQCSVVFMFGLIINVIRGLPQFNLIASIGGFLYATGNVASVPIVAEMGIGLGMLIWGSVQIIVGWCVAHFGLFGTKPQNVQNPLLNYLGVLITLFSGIMFVFVYSREERDKKLSPIEKDYDNNRIAYRSERAPSTYGTVHNVWAVESEQDNGNNASTTLENLPRIEQSEIKRTVTPRLTKRKLFFIGLAVCLGSLHGLMLTPIVYVQDTDPLASKNVLDYVFSHFSAVFFFSTFYFIIYTLILKGKPYVQSNLVLPSIAYGILWSIGMTLFIVSNKLLSQTVSFPITVRLPAIIGALADVLIFKSIKGKMQMSFLFAAIIAGSVGVILVGISLY
ncbi:unnamed protein product [Meloidogyne enterolobii]|uniref:Uncharacterized protein n=2 Tax=Meloidogyne enterolobii TaxID=390850 RepID=A0ACB1A7P4_MELEN|nr:unnamed protein product [Meloidogyne enterolobii]